MYICPLRSFSISLIWDLALDADFNEVADDLSLRVNMALQPVNCTHLEIELITHFIIDNHILL